MRLEESLQQIDPDDVDEINHRLNAYAIDSCKKNEKELCSNIKYLKKTYSEEIYAPIEHIYNVLVTNNG